MNLFKNLKKNTRKADGPKQKVYFIVYCGRYISKS